MKAYHDSEEEEKWWELEFEVDRMQLYHDKRYYFFRKLRKTIVFFTLIYSSSVIYSTIINFPTILLISSILILVLYFAEIAFNFSDQEHQHHDLYKRYHLLLAKIEADAQNKEETLKYFREEYKLIEREQPEILMALGFWCHNKVAIAKKVSQKYLYNLSFFQRILMHWLQFAHIQPRNSMGD